MHGEGNFVRHMSLLDQSGSLVATASDENVSCILQICLCGIGYLGQRWSDVPSTSTIMPIHVRINTWLETSESGRVVADFASVCRTCGRADIGLR